jgi:hypothetical protein
LKKNFGHRKTPIWWEFRQVKQERFDPGQGESRQDD